MDRVRVYLIAKTKPEYHERNDALCAMLDGRYGIFKPHELPQASQYPPSMIGEDIVDRCFNALSESQVSLAIAPYGNDCSAELGYCLGKNKPVVLVVDNDGNWREDWMSKASIAGIVVMDHEQKLVGLLDNDPILNKLPRIIKPNSQELSDFVYGIVTSYRK